MRENFDLVVTRPNGESVGYVVETPTASMGSSSYGLKQASIEHSKTAPNIPMNVGMSTPTQAGGAYDVRDSDGDKAITHIDWSLGAGQESLDLPSSHPSMFLSSFQMDITTPGVLRIQRMLGYQEVLNASGPAYYALGYYWVACEGGEVRYSPSGSTWYTAAISPAVGGIVGGFTSDGTSLYFSVAYGENTGVWKSNLSHPFSFTRICSTAIMDIAYSGGLIYAATATGAGYIDPITNVYSEETMSFISPCPTIGLDAVSGAVYWTIYRGGMAVVYRLFYDVGLGTMTTTEATSIMSGFVATCTHPHLDSLYVGGYYESSREEIGQGGVYVLTGGAAIPLVKLGRNPDSYPDLTDEELDTRVYAMCTGADKLYIQCARGYYAWDINDGGYHHVARPRNYALEYVEQQSPTDAFQASAFQASAFQTSEREYAALILPGIAYGKGRLVTPWMSTDATQDQSFGNSAANPSVFTVGYSDVKFEVGQYVLISDSTSTPQCNGGWYVDTLINERQFTIKSAVTGTPFSCSVDGGGTVRYNPERGVARHMEYLEGTAELITSPTNFHTGSLAKDFFEVVVSHDKIVRGSIAIAHNIDGAGWRSAPQTSTSDTESSYRIGVRGYSITLKISLTGQLGTTYTPTVHAVNCVWNFVPVKRHSYALDCRKGAQEGRWAETPEVAITHLYDASDEHCTFEDRFSGEYVGVIEGMEYQQAQYSASEGVSGLVKVVVREV